MWTHINRHVNDKPFKRSKGHMFSEETFQPVAVGAQYLLCHIQTTHTDTHTDTHTHTHTHTHTRGDLIKITLKGDADSLIRAFQQDVVVPDKLVVVKYICVYATPASWCDLRS